MDELIGAYEVTVVEAGCAPGSGRYGVRIDVPNDISAIFPYLNAALDNVWYDPEGQILIWRQPTQAYAFRPHEITVARIENPVQGANIAREMAGKVNAVWAERHNITPLFTNRKLPSVIGIFKLLPRTNCGKCGYTTCLAYAAALRSAETEVGRCLPIMEEKYVENANKLCDLLAPD